MFGNRSKYKNSFQLWIPSTLMENWTKCFAFHQLAIQAARSGMGAPVWLSDHRTTPTSPASIDRSFVDFEDGEMSFGIFAFEDHLYMGEPGWTDLQRLECLRKNLSEKCFPSYVYQYLKTQRKKEGDICFHEHSVFGSERSNYTPEEIASVRRKKGIFSTNEFRRGGRPNARHHLKIFRNEHGQARLFYKINGHTIRFIQNKK
jgi:hypothetical protein